MARKNTRSGSPSALKEAMKNGSSGRSVEARGPEQTIYQYLQQQRSQIEKALPKHMDAERLSRVAFTVIRQTPQLLECTVPSLLGAVMQAAQLGLEPIPTLGHCWFIPFWNNKAKVREVQFILGYTGMLELAHRSGRIETIYAHVVREHDHFEYEYGLEPRLEHKPARENRGDITDAYMVAKFKDGGYYFEVMSIDDIEKRRARSKASNKGPWVTDYEDMCRKTVVRHAFKYLPVSVEIQRGIAQDESIKHDIDDVDAEMPDYGDSIDIDYTVQEDQDDDADPQQEETESTPEQDPEDKRPGHLITEEQIDAILSICERREISQADLIARLQERYDTDQLDELTRSQAIETIRDLQK